MNAILKPATTQAQSPSAHHLDVTLGLRIAAEAGKRSLERTLQALFRERLLYREYLITEGSISWLPLWSLQAMLRFEGLSVGRTGDCRLAGNISYYHHGEPPRLLSNASALLTCIAPLLPGQADTDYAWSIKPAVNAAFIGAGFLAGTLATGLVLWKAQRWRTFSTLPIALWVLAFTDRKSVV